MQGEENLDIQTRSSNAVASFIEFCVHHNISQPPDKIVKNLCTFLCQDMEKTPPFAFTSSLATGILSFQSTPKNPPSRNGKDDATDQSDASKSEENAKARLARRGASLAFERLSQKFGPRLFDVMPNMWQSMAGGLLSPCVAGTSVTQSRVDSLTFHFL
jgi:TATA-binding protein-associated factor